VRSRIPRAARRPAGHWAAVVTAVGALLVGIAAVIEIFVSTGTENDSGNSDNTTSSLSPPKASSATALGFVEFGSTFRAVAEDSISSADQSFAGFREVHASDRRFSVRLPKEWDDIEKGPWREGGSGRFVAAATRVRGLYDDYTTPGFFVGVTAAPSITADQFTRKLKRQRDGVCSNGRSGRFDGGGFTGTFHIWLKCGGTSMAIADLAVESRITGSFVHVMSRVSSRRDLEAAQRALSTLDLPPAVCKDLDAGYGSPLGDSPQLLQLKQSCQSQKPSGDG